MNTPTRLGGFALILTAALGAGYGVGAAVGPVGAGPSAGATGEHARSETVGPASPSGGPDGHGVAKTPGRGANDGARLGDAPEGGGVMDALGGLAATDPPPFGTDLFLDVLVDGQSSPPPSPWTSPK